MAPKKAPEPPPHLSRRCKTFWRAVVGAYELEPEHLEILRRACEASDRVDQARVLLDKEGLTTTDRYGQVKAHPAAAVEIQNRRALAALIAQLRLGEDAPGSRTEAARSLALKRWSA